MEENSEIIVGFMLYNLVTIYIKYNLVKILPERIKEH